MLSRYGAIREFIRVVKKYGFSSAVSINKQYRSQKELIEFTYHGEKLQIKNEKASLYVLLHHVDNMITLVNALTIVDDPKQIFLDIGANCGLFAYFFKKKFPQTMLYLFEPNIYLNDIISYNLRAFSNWELVNKAISNIQTGTAFFINDNSCQSSSLLKSKSNYLNPSDSLTILQVETTTIDQFCQEHSISELIGLKLDIQGTEAKALQGAEKLLKNTKLLLLEFWLQTDIFSLMNRIPPNFRQEFYPVNDGRFYADILFISRNQKYI